MMSNGVVSHTHVHRSVLETALNPKPSQVTTKVKNVNISLENMEDCLYHFTQYYHHIQIEWITNHWFSCCLFVSLTGTAIVQNHTQSNTHDLLKLIYNMI